MKSITETANNNYSQSEGRDVSVSTRFKDKYSNKSSNPNKTVVF